MSTEQTEAAHLYVARLMHGDSYDTIVRDKTKDENDPTRLSRSRTFRAGFDYVIDEELMLHLSESAVFTVLSPGFEEAYDAPEDRTTLKSMFDFRLHVAGEDLEHDDADIFATRQRNSAEREERRARVVSEISSGARRAIRRRNEDHQCD